MGYKDWELTTDSDLKIGDNVDYIVLGSDELVQRLKFRLRIFLGEYYLNTDLGVDYYGKIFKKSPSFVIIEQEFRRIILETAGVKDLIELKIVKSETRERGLDVSFSLNTDDDVLLQDLIEV